MINKFEGIYTCFLTGKMTNILIIDQELIELVGGECIKSDIKLPDNLTFISFTLDNNIMAFCEVGDFILIYELEGRQFELKHRLNRRQTDMPSSLISALRCSYIQGLLIVNHSVFNNKNIFTIIDLHTATIIHMCYGGYPQYCDGLLTFPPLYSDDYNKIFNSINLADKTVSKSAIPPYFMEKINQISINVKEEPSIFDSNLTIIGNSYYQTATGTLLGTSVPNQAGDQFYGSYLILSRKLEIAPGAPVIEYKYKGKYLYIITNTTGKLTKAAAQHSDG